MMYLYNILYQIFFKSTIIILILKKIIYLSTLHQGYHRTSTVCCNTVRHTGNLICFFGILRNFSACLTTAVLLVLMTSAAVFLTVGAGLAAGLGGATTYITPIIAILVTTIAQACVWPMYRDLFGPKNLFERLD